MLSTKVQEKPAKACKELTVQTFNMLNDDFLYQGAQNIFVFQLSLIYIDANSSLFSDKDSSLFWDQNRFN